MAVDFLNTASDFDMEDNAAMGGYDGQTMYWMSDMKTTDEETVTGYFTGTGNAALDNAVEMYNIDRREKGLGEIDRVTIVHAKTKKTKPGESNEKEYWMFSVKRKVWSGMFEQSALTIIPLIKGLKSPEQDQGLVNVWKIDRTKVVKVKDGRELMNSSYLRFRFIIADLVKYDFRLPFIMLGRSYKAGHTLDALRKQRDLFKTYRGMKGMTEQQLPLPFWAFAITMGKTEPITVGEGEKQKTLPYPMAVVPEKPGEDYFKQRYFTSLFPGEGLGELKMWLRSLTEESVEWARESRESILKGEDDPAEEEFFPSTEGNGNGMSNAEFLTASDDEITANEGQRKALFAFAKQNRGNPTVVTLLTNAAKDPATTYAQAGKLIDTYSPQG